MGVLRIGEVAKQAETGIETIRFYERQGLLAEPRRKPSGYRQYDESAVARLRFIRRAKELGFTLAEVKELLGLWFDTATRCEHVRERASQKLEVIGEKIRSLQKMKRSLGKLIRQCERRESFIDCPLWQGLDALDRRDDDAQATEERTRRE